MGYSLELGQDNRSTIPLCVDLDGTLIRTDMAVECLVLALKKEPWLVAVLPFWLLQGRAVLKRRLAERARFDPATLPYNHEFLEFLKAERGGGRKLVLATASDRIVAEQIASHLALFDQIIASQPGDNVKGLSKLAELRRRYPEGFDYAGDSPTDTSILIAAQRAILVYPARSLKKAVGGEATVERVFEKSVQPLWSRLRSALRVHQWSKNVLVFVPLVTSHRITDPADLKAGLLSFAAFCFCSSGVYVINDIVDLESDRQHPLKRHRPFASGALPVPAGFLLGPTMLALSAGVAMFLSPAAQAVLAIYFILTCLYSFYLKRKLLVDVFSLSALFTLRIIVSHAATGIPFSPWLLSFVMFLFLSLAFSKRTSELRSLSKAGRDVVHGRAYYATDIEVVTMFGVGSGMIAALVFSLYINSAAVQNLYRTPQILWLICPVFLYWICRIWVISSRGRMHEDPILFALCDRVTYFVAVVCGVIMLAATRVAAMLPHLRMGAW